MRRGADDAVQWQALAVGKDGPFVEHFRALARELRMAIAITYLRGADDGCRNSVSLFDREGAEVLTYDKVHTCAFDLPEALLAPGDGFSVGVLRTADEEVSVGAMICFDREFPESARCLALLGAELILTPNACPLTSTAWPSSECARWRTASPWRWRTIPPHRTTGIPSRSTLSGTRETFRATICSSKPASRRASSPWISTSPPSANTGSATGGARRGGGLTATAAMLGSAPPAFKRVDRTGRIFGS